MSTVAITVTTQVAQMSKILRVLWTVESFAPATVMIGRRIRYLTSMSRKNETIANSPVANVTPKMIITSMIESMGLVGDALLYLPLQKRGYFGETTVVAVGRANIVNCRIKYCTL